MQNRNLPNCPVCSKTLGTHGLPATLPCGHNGCVECLRSVQRKGAAQCPVCQCAFGEELPIAPNTELRDLIALATTLFMDDKEREDGWEAFPNKALTAEQYATDLQQERAAAQPPPFSSLSPLLANAGPPTHPMSQPAFYPYGPPGCGELEREGAGSRRGVPVPGCPSFRAARPPYSVPSSFAGGSPYGSSPTEARLPQYPGSYSPLESYIPFSRRAPNGSDCGGYCQEDLAGEEGGTCAEPQLKSHASNNSLGGAESPQLSSSPASFSSNAMILAHQGGQGMTAFASGGNGLAPAAAAAAATAAAMRQLMELLPPQWLPDSMASACGGCHKPFRPLVRLRHHCRCCGRIFCQACSGTHVLLPPKFNTREPQRVCDMCASMLSSLQPYLASTQTTAAQPPVLDALDAVSLRTWVNAPYCATLEGDVFKAANVLSKFTKAARLQPEAGLPTALLAGAKGLVVMSLIKLGAGWSATFGTGVVVSRASDGVWSAPCSVAAYGLGWGFQVGGELTDLLLVLRTEEAVRAFNGAVHVGLGGNVSVAAGPLGRHADATLMTGTASPPGVPAAAYSYSCSQGAFVGVSVEGTLLTVRSSVNRAFYGLPVTANDLLVPPWAMAPPPAAATLYEALADMTRKYENRRRYIHAAPTPSSASSTPIPTLDCAHSPANTITTASPTVHTLEGAPLLYHHTTFSKPSPSQGGQQLSTEGYHTANNLDSNSSSAHAEGGGLNAVLEGRPVAEHTCEGTHKVDDGQPSQPAHICSSGTLAKCSKGQTGKAMAAAGTESGVVPILVPAASVTQLDSRDDADVGSHQEGDADMHAPAVETQTADAGVQEVVAHVDVAKRNEGSLWGLCAEQEVELASAAPAATAAGEGVGKESAASTNSASGESTDVVQASLQGVSGGEAVAASSTTSSSSARSSKKAKAAAARAAAAAAAEASARSASESAPDDGRSGDRAAAQLRGQGEGKDDGQQKELDKEGFAGAMEEKERGHSNSGPQAENGMQQPQESPEAAQASQSPGPDALGKGGKESRKLEMGSAGQQGPQAVGSGSGQGESAEDAQGGFSSHSLHSDKLGVACSIPEPMAMPDTTLGVGDGGGGAGGGNSADPVASRQASTPSPAGDPMDGWCFDGVAGVLEGCFEDEGPAGPDDSCSGMDASSQIRAQPCSSSSGHDGEIAKAAAVQSGAACMPPAQGNTQPAQPSTTPSLPDDLDMLDMLLGGEQPPEATLGHEPKEHNSSAAQPAAELLVEGGEGAQKEGQGAEQGSSGHQERKGRPAGSPDLMECSDAEGGAVGSYTSRTGATSEAVVGSLGSDTSGIEGAMSASSVCGSAPTQSSSSLPGPLVGSAPTGGSIGPTPQRRQVSSKGGGKKGKKKR